MTHATKTNIKRHNNKAPEIVAKAIIRFSAVTESRFILSLNLTHCRSLWVSFLVIVDSIKAGTISSQKDTRGSPKSFSSDVNEGVAEVNLKYSRDSDVYFGHCG